jgi:hypothetical protein
MLICLQAEFAPRRSTLSIDTMVDTMFVCLLYKEEYMFGGLG